MSAAAGILALAAALAAPSPSEIGEVSEVSDGRYAMGTVLEISVRGGERDLLDELYAEVDRLESVLSPFQAGSDLSRLNRSAGDGPLAVDPSLVRLVSDAVAYHALTRGAFDVTVGPIVRLWRDAMADGHVPSSSARMRARRKLGTDALLADGARGTVEIARAGVSVDPGGVGKGFALDVLAERLRGRTAGALLSFGQSSTCALGTPAGADGWRVLVRDAAGGFAGVATLRDRSLSVSGSLAQSVEIAGRRYGHIVDPRTGAPLTERRIAAVVAPAGGLAEALSKALLVLGPAEGLALLDELPGAEGLLLDASGERWESAGWTRAVAFEPWSRDARIH